MGYDGSNDEPDPPSTNAAPAQTTIAANNGTFTTNVSTEAMFEVAGEAMEWFAAARSQAASGK